MDKSPARLGMRAGSAAEDAIEDLPKYAKHLCPPVRYAALFCVESATAGIVWLF
jgi:hypothetical protein